MVIDPGAIPVSRVHWSSCYRVVPSRFPPIQLFERVVDPADLEAVFAIEALEALPGVGHKTASVVMAQAFGVPAFPVDTHIHRLAKRWKLTEGRNVVQTERDLKKLFPRERWNALHLQIIFFGRQHCSARGCDGKSCLLCRELFPPKG